MKKLLILFMVFFLLTNSISAVCEENQVDINSASLGELDEIYGIGSVKAQAIIDARPYETVDDLTNALGIGEKTLENIKNQGLACVEGNEENGDGEESISDEEEIENEESVNVIEEPNSKEIIKSPPKKTELEIINLNSKDIKTENNKDFQDNEDKQNSGIGLFIGFCVLLFLLFSVKLIKNKFQYKNEFG